MNTRLYKAIATISYGEADKVSALIEPDLARYYLSLVPKWFGAKSQAYAPHITVVRTKKEQVVDRAAWGRHEGRIITFEYSPIVRFNEPYFWLDCWSEEIGDIRQELGLPPFRAMFDRYHITIGNTKVNP